MAAILATAHGAARRAATTSSPRNGIFGATVAAVRQHPRRASASTTSFVAADRPRRLRAGDDAEHASCSSSRRRPIR
ncbi:MAG: hypothetical protein MZW92_79520 [Comamonadaceae bacterium]|nr:hypothetical protein [Comamonadaceae bacterium]